ncbi:MAG: DUF2802 domain-containing protein [Glaciecola sp.]
MSALLTPNHLFFALLLMLSLLLVCVWVFVKYSQATNAKIAQSVKLINELYQLSKAQEQSIKALQVGKLDSDDKAVNIAIEQVSKNSQALALLEKELRAVENNTQLLQNDDPSLKMYNRANQLVVSGASIDDIMQACDLPRAEAEVLISLHRKKKTPTDF